MAEANKYSMQERFKFGSPGAYNAARRRNILKEACAHMSEGRKPKYSKEYLLKQALKYKTKEEFREKARNLYSAVWERGFYKEATKHMTLIHRNLELKEYPKFDRVFKPYFRIYKTHRNKKRFGFSPDRILEKDGKFYVIEIKRDNDYNTDCKDQLKKYNKIAKRVFKTNFMGVF